MSERWALVALVGVACGSRPESIEPSGPTPLPEHRDYALDDTPAVRRRMVPPEAFLRAYLTWFGGLAPLEVQKRAHGFDLFDQWTDYLAALGLPDYHLDAPRVGQSNAMMMATIGRLAEALCVRAAEHDFRVKTEPQVVFVFDLVREPSRQDFADRFDILHRTFLGYPIELAPHDRVDKFYAFYRDVAARHASGRLQGDAAAWAATCVALIQHPETGLY